MWYGSSYIRISIIKPGIIFSWKIIIFLRNITTQTIVKRIKIDRELRIIVNSSQE